VKKPLLILGVLAAAAFLAITLVKEKAARSSAAICRPDAAEVDRIKDFWAAFNRGNALRAQGAFAPAVPAFRKALEINPHHEDSLYYLGTSLYETGEYEQAAIEFRKILAENPSSGRAWSELGDTLSIQAPGAPVDLTAARRAYQRSSELNPEQAGPFLRIGHLDLNCGRLNSALTSFHLAAGFGSPEGNYLLAYTLFLQGREREALPYLRKILETYRRERKITGRGVLSEGDVLPGPGQPLTALDKSALKSILLLDRIAQREGGYPLGLPSEFRVAKRQPESGEFRPAGGESGLRPDSGRGAWADFDKDGHPDLLLARPRQPVVLYRNLGGIFSDVTAAAGLDGARDAWDAVWADYNGDGYPDLFLIRPGYTGRGRNSLFRNNHNGTFTEVTARVGLEGERSTIRACFADFTGTGRLDLLEVGAADAAHSSVRLYRNTGAGFLEITRAAGLESSKTAVDCAVADYDHDGRQDLFIQSWKQGPFLYHNDGSNRFSDTTLRAGLEGFHGTSFSALFLDYDNDGWPDLLISAQAPFEEAARCLLQPGFRAARDTPRLFHNQRDGHFEEVTLQAGLDRCYGTIQAVAADLDSDGWTDLLLVNGGFDVERFEPSVALHNERGQGFKEWFYLPGLDKPSNLIGASISDSDRDGRREIYLAGNPLLPASVSRPGLFARCPLVRASR
jgi:tetratricopeptide (TPR) repeat protein